MQYQQTSITTETNGFIQFIINFCHRMPINWLGLRIVFVIRKLILIFGREPFLVRVKGVKFNLYPSDNLSDKRLLCTPGLLDGDERQWLEKKLALNGWVLDIGANIGGYSLLLKQQRTDLNVLAIEPDPYLYQRLQTNLELNNYNKFDLLACAVTDQNQKICLSLDKHNRGRNVINNNRDEACSQQTVEGKTLAAILNNRNIDAPELIKMDIEGHEHIVLSSFLSDMQNKPLFPRFFQIEQYRKQKLNQAVKLIQQNGYDIVFRGRMNVLLEKTS